MKKARTYVLFEHNKYFKFYLRGAYYNTQMNRILCPDWDTVIYVDINTYNNNIYYFEKIIILGAGIALFDHKLLCSSMLMRLKPIEQYDVIACRDIDAITTLRDVETVNEFVSSNAIAHGMNDNPAHGGMPLMGGMCAFKKESLQDINWENAMLPEHGQDQQFLMATVYPKVKDRFLFHRTPPDHNYKNPLWESDLCCRHIGSAGINEMETLRFFERQGIDHESFTNKFVEIF